MVSQARWTSPAQTPTSPLPTQIATSTSQKILPSARNEDQSKDPDLESGSLCFNLFDGYNWRMTEGQSRFTLPLALFTAIVAVSTSSIFIRFAQTDAPSLVIAALRLAFATLLLAPFALPRYSDELKRLTRTETMMGIVSGLFLAAHFGTWTTSLEYTSVASSVVFVSTGPLWVALLSPMLLNERLTGAAIVGLVISILG